MKSPVLAATLAAVLATSTLGCYRTRFDLAPPSAETTSVIYDNHFHWSIINIIEISSPVNLATACGGAPATAIEEETGVLAGIVNLALSYFIPILHAKNATVKCGGIMMQDRRCKARRCRAHRLRSSAR